MIDSLPPIVNVILPVFAGKVLRPGAVRPAVVTSIADAAANKINCCVFLEAGDVNLKNAGDTFWVANVEYTDGTNDNVNVPRWYAAGQYVS